jgi:hypothetical protein
MSKPHKLSRLNMQGKLHYALLVVSPPEEGMVTTRLRYPALTT